MVATCTSLARWIFFAVLLTAAFAPRWFCPPKVNIAYYAIPKAGTTTMKTWLATHAENIDPDSVPAVDDKKGGDPGVGRYVRINGKRVELTGCPNVINCAKGRYCFMIIRHPFTRLASAFEDKVLHHKCAYYPFRRFCPAQSWPQFVKAIVTRSFHDTHIAPLRNLLPEHKKNVHFGKIEKFDEIWRIILKKANYTGDKGIVKSNMGELFTETSNKTAYKYANYFQDPLLVSSVLAFYKMDLITFSYNLEEVLDPALTKQLREAKQLDPNGNLIRRCMAHGPASRNCIVSPALSSRFSAGFMGILGENTTAP